MRSVHIVASTQLHVPRPSLCTLLSPATAGRYRCSLLAVPLYGLHASTSLPPFPDVVFAPHACRGIRCRFGTMRTLTPEHITLHSGLPAYLAATSRRSASNHVVRSRIALSTNCQRAGLLPGFTMSEQARRHTPPNRVRHPTDRQFASGCSPPRLAATQLPSATGPWLTPTRTRTVLLRRHHRRTHPGRRPGVHVERLEIAGLSACLPPHDLDSCFRRDDERGDGMTARRNGAEIGGLSLVA